MIRFCLYLIFVSASSVLATMAVWMLLIADGYVSEAIAGICALAAGVYMFFFTALHLPLDPAGRDLGDFLWRFTLMHLVIIVSLWGVFWGSTVLAPGLPAPVQWLFGGVALFLGFTGSYRILFDISLESNWSRGLRLVMFRVAKRRADAARKPGDPGLLWGGVRLPSETATSHFLCLGTTRSGKTLCLRLLMQDALRAIRPGSDHRALIYDAKQDILPMLAGMDLHCEVVTMAPFDQRGVAWDMAADVTCPAIAYQIASILIPEEKNASQPFFSDAARDLLAGVMIALMQVAPGRWKFRHVLLILKSPTRLRKILEATAETRDLCIYLDEPRTMMDILATLSTKMAPFRAIAAAWAQADRAFSLREWLEGEFILVLGNDETCRTPVDAVNRVLFQRVTELILSQGDSNTRRTWIILDEVREAGRLKLNTLMTKSGSRGGAVVLAGQDIEGLRDVYGDAQTKEILSQASHKAILRLESPEAAKWASELAGHYEAVETRTSDGWTSGPQGTNRTVSLAEQYVRREAVMPSEFMSLPLTNRTNGLTGYFLSPVTGVFRSTLSPAFLTRALRNPDPNVPGIVRRSEREQYLGGWREDDWGYLSLLPPPPPATDGGADAASPQTGSGSDPNAPENDSRRDNDDPDTRHRNGLDRGL